MLIILGKKALSGNQEVIYFYFFLTLVCIFRACSSIFIEPWPLQPIPAAAIGQMIATLILALMMFIISTCLYRKLKRNSLLSIFDEKVYEQLI